MVAQHDTLKTETVKSMDPIWDSLRSEARLAADHGARFGELRLHDLEQRTFFLGAQVLQQQPVVGCRDRIDEGHAGDGIGEYVGARRCREQHGELARVVGDATTRAARKVWRAGVVGSGDRDRYLAAHEVGESAVDQRSGECVHGVLIIDTMDRISIMCGLAVRP